MTKTIEEILEAMDKADWTSSTPLPTTPEESKEERDMEIQTLKDMQVGETLALVNFTGKMRLGDVQITGTDWAYIYCNEMKFDNQTGIQVNAKEAKYANRIMLISDAPAKVASAPKKKPRKEVEVDFTPAPTPKDGKVRHYQYETIKTCITCDIPVYLVGDAGTGKNHTLQEIAMDMGLEFYFTNSVQQEYKITGFIDAGGVYHETEFYKAFKDGGLFFLDELDASIPEVLVLLNAAIANRYFEFPNGRINAHEKFRVVAAGNTSGSGANELYTGRLVLDSATLDRFVEIEFGYDKNIELQLAKGNTDLVNFIRGLRQFAVQNGIRATFSYRAIISVTKLESAGLQVDQILKIAVFKGIDKDTINTFKVQNSGKYFHAMERIQKGA